MKVRPIVTTPEADDDAREIFALDRRRYRAPGATGTTRSAATGR
jgi:hypothetical protein